MGLFAKKSTKKVGISGISSMVYCSNGIGCVVDTNGRLFIKSKSTGEVCFIAEKGEFDIKSFWEDLIVICLKNRYMTLTREGMKYINIHEGKSSCVRLVNCYAVYIHTGTDLVRVTEDGIIKYKVPEKLLLFSDFNYYKLNIMCENVSKDLLYISKKLGEEFGNFIEWDIDLEDSSKRNGVVVAEGFGTHSDSTFFSKKELPSGVEYREYWVSSDGMFSYNRISEEEYWTAYERYIKSIKSMAKVKVIPEKPVDKVNVDTITLSEAQVSKFDKVLIRIRTLLSRNGKVGTASLYEVDGVTFLDVGMDRFYLKDGELKGSNLNYTSKEELEIFVKKTIELLVMNIPLKVKKIMFTVGEEHLTKGTVRKSSDEKGAVEVLLS